uniref:Uncharacterized protein n=1 Tax=Aegilops tauschii subsp. strangulata TaxID=200361 RepID=A0A452ZSR2_AEGTS
SSPRHVASSESSLQKEPGPLSPSSSLLPQNKSPLFSPLGPPPLPSPIPQLQRLAHPL